MKAARLTLEMRQGLGLRQGGSDHSGLIRRFDTPRLRARARPFLALRPDALAEKDDVDTGRPPERVGVRKALPRGRSSR